MTPWTRIGIAPTPDTRAIKRAYARALKVTRPSAHLLRVLVGAGVMQALIAAVPSPTLRLLPVAFLTYSMCAVALFMAFNMKRTTKYQHPFA